METTIQQVTQYPMCDRSVPDSSGAVARTNNLTVNGVPQGTPTWELPLPLQDQAYGGLMGLNSSFYLPTICSSGNCSIADFWIVGYSSECHESTSQLRVSNDTDDRGLSTLYTWPSTNLSIRAFHTTPKILNPYLMSSVINSSFAFEDSEEWQPWGATIQILLSNSLGDIYSVECQLQPALQKISSAVVRLSPL